jgi:hypothetical protein
VSADHHVTPVIPARAALEIPRDGRARGDRV